MAQVTPATDTYQWGRFETGGGGYFTGIAFSPNTPGLMYVRSDVTFMHRMNPGQTRWTSTGDRFWPEKVAGKSGSRYPFGGSIGIAIHPVNPQIVFTTYGYADNNFDGTRGVYRTADGGQTWEQVLSVNANGNSSAEQVNQRKCGNPIAIDPSDPNVVYVGTQSNGLYRSTTGGGLNSWTKINSVPNSPGSLAGTKCVVVDRFSTLTAGRRSVVYASVYNDGVYRSSDGSNTFIKLTGSPKSPQWMVQGPTGTLYVTNEYNSANGSTGGIWKFDGSTWSEITPAGNANKSFLGFDVNPFQANQLVATANDFNLYRSNDGGANWDVIPNSAQQQIGDLNYTGGGGNIRSLFQAASTIHFDPHSNGVVYYCDAFMVWKSTNVYVTTVQWEPLYQGLNNSIPFTMLAPPQSAANDLAPFYAGGADGSNFRYDAVGGKPAAYFSKVAGIGQQYLTSMDFVETKPNLFWIVTNRANGATDSQVAWSEGGNLNVNTNWNSSTPYGANVQTGGTKIGVSANNPKNVVITPGYGLKNKVTFDAGASWNDCRGLPGGALQSGGGAYDRILPMVSDRVNGRKFYLYHPRNDGEFYRSVDGGYNWTLVNTAIPGVGGSDGDGAPQRVASAPFMDGQVWVSLSTNGLWKSSNGGSDFTKVSYFTEVRSVDFGINKPGITTPTVFVHAKEASSGQWGIFRSVDLGVKWEMVTDANQPFTNVRILKGDRKVFGRVYFDNSDSGILYGQVTSSVPGGTPPAAPLNVGATPQTSETIRISWTDNSANENLFRIYRKKTGQGTFQLIGLSGFNQTSYLDQDIEFSTAYDYFVESFNESGTGQSAPVSTTSLAGLAAPASLSATATAFNQIVLTWGPSSGQTGYSIEYAIGDAPFTSLTTVSSTATSFTHTGLTEQTTYTYRIQATQTVGQVFSKYTNESSATTPINNNLTTLVVNASNGNAQINRTLGANTLVVDTPIAQGNLRIGRNATSVAACTVYPFQLPAIPAGFELERVEFRVKVEEISAGSTHTIQLWALPVRSAKTVLTGDYYDGSPFPTTATGTLINGTFANTSALTVGDFLTTTATDASTLGDFVKLQYANGGAGNFMFLRLSQNSAQDSKRIGVDMTGDTDDNATTPIIPQLTLVFRANIVLRVHDEYPSFTAMAFPNPGAEQVTVEVRGADGYPIQLLLTDITGKVIIEKQIKSDSSRLQIPLSLSKYAAGLYLLRVSAKGQCTTLKVIKQ